ncbi:hypothetical protein [Chitinophaga rupis]|nr:hypothetical protein [Chitinophaga rupis]
MIIGITNAQLMGGLESSFNGKAWHQIPGFTNGVDYMKLIMENDG